MSIMIEAGLFIHNKRIKGLYCGSRLNWKNGGRFSLPLNDDRVWFYENEIKDCLLIETRFMLE